MSALVPLPEPPWQLAALSSLGAAIAWGRRVWALRQKPLLAGVGEAVRAAVCPWLSRNRKVWAAVAGRGVFPLLPKVREEEALRGAVGV